MTPIGPMLRCRTLGFLSVVFLLTGWPIPCHGDIGVAPRPADFIEDDSRLLNGETRPALAAALARAAEADLRIGFAATTILPHPAIATDLKEKWFPNDARAVMIVYSRDVDRFLVADAREKDPLFHGFASSQAINRANATLTSLNRDRDGRDPIIAGEATSLVRALVESAQVSSGNTRFPEVAQMIGLWMGATALLALPIFLILRGSRRSRMRAHGERFPDLVVPPRLGAPHGGIMGAELRAPPPNQFSHPGNASPTRDHGP